MIVVGGDIIQFNAVDTWGGEGTGKTSTTCCCVEISEGRGGPGIVRGSHHM